MMKTKYKLNKATRQFIKPWLIIMSMTLAVTATAATNDNTGSTFVDSVHQWGAWGLDIEPAAGGLQAQTTQPMNARGAKVDLRTNSISALAPQLPVAEIITRPPGSAAPTTFAPPAATPPTTFSPLPSPNVVPVDPGTTLPTGNGSLFQ